MKDILESNSRTLILFLIIIFSNQIHSQDFEFIAQHEGKASAIGNYGNYTYFSSGGNINILETVANNEFNLINRFHTNSRYSNDITIDSNRMFVSTSNEVLIYNLSDPENPELIGAASPTYSQPKGSIILDTLLIIKCKSKAFLYNIANPLNPEHLSTIFYDNNRHCTYALNQNILYGFEQIGYSGPQSIVGYDISDPGSPFRSVSLQVSPDYQGAWPNDMDSQDNYLYVDFSDTLKIYDISTPDTIINLTQFPAADEIHHLILDNNNIYIATIDTGIFIYDLSNLYEPELLGIYNQPEIINEFKINSEYIFCGLGNKGAVIANKSDIQNIQDVYSYSQTDAVYSVHIKDDFAYFGMKESGLQIVDINNIQEPNEYGNIHSLSNIERIESIPDYLYCSKSSDSVIHIVDVSDYTNPQKVGEILAEHAWINDYCIDQNRMFLIDSSEYIEIYDLSLPESPNLLATFNENGRHLAVNDSYLIQGEAFGDYPSECKLKLFIVGDDNSLTHQDEFVLGEYSTYAFQKIEIDYPYVYVCFRKGLLILKINDDDNLTFCDEMTWTAGASYMEDMVYDDNYIYLSGIFSNQYLINIIDKTDPNNLSVYQSVDNYCNNLAVSNNYFFGTIANNGYFIYGNDITGFNYTEPKENEFNITCNPNPCDNMTTINFTIQNNIKSKLEIFNLLGQGIYETDVTNKNHLVIETENFTPGVYLCKISTNNQYTTQKLIIKR